jgi:hypothetical protein
MMVAPQLDQLIGADQKYIWMNKHAKGIKLLVESLNNIEVMRKLDL